MDMFRLAVLSLVGIANIGLGLVVYVRNSKNVANRSFAEAVFVIVCWLSLDFIADQALFVPHALLIRKATLTSAMLMGALLLYFALNFPKRDGPLPLAWQVFFGAGGVLMALTLLTNTVAADIQVTNWGTNMIPGPLLPLMAVWAVSGIVSVVVVLVHKFRHARHRAKAQLKFILLGIALFACSSVVLGLLLPMITGSYQLARLNMLSTLLLTGFTAYAMVKHRLMDIRLVVLRGAAYTVLFVLSGASFVLLITVMRVTLSSVVVVNQNVLFFIAGLVVIFGFQPVRYALEHATDRIFHRHRYDPQQLLAQLSTAMTATIDLQRLARLIVDSLKGEMRLKFAALVCQDENGSVRVTTDSDIAAPDMAQLKALGSGGKMLLADDLDPVSPVGNMLATYQTRVVLPLAVDGEAIGAILLGPKQSGEMFSPIDVQFLRILAPQAAIAIRNAQLFGEKTQRVRELTALNKLAFALGGNTELDSLLDTALRQVVSVTGADSGSIMLLDEAETTLTIAASHGIPQEVVAETRINVGDRIAGWVAETKEALILVDGTDPRFKQELVREDIVSAITVPLVCKNTVIGVLSVNRKESPEFFTNESLNVVTSFAGQLAVTIENAKLYRDLENTFLGTITALAAAVDAKDPYTYGHSNAVMTYTVATAAQLGLGEKEVQTARVAATLHDIGKIGIDGAILHKPGDLTAEERAAIDCHPTIGANILASLDFLQDAVPLILFHHERFGGGGYPSGVSGEAIPLGARIIAVADAFNAMVSDRPYRVALPHEEAVNELKRHSGSQFDPVVVSAFLRVLAREKQAEVLASRRARAAAARGRRHRTSAPRSIPG